jgi:LmeA-like phospholipid-binding
VKRLLVGLVFAVALLVLVDRIAVIAAEHEVSTRIQQEQGLIDAPGVDIGGFPFLTQAIAGHYDHVTLKLSDLRRGPVPVTRLTARLSGVRVPLSDVIGRHLGRVPVDRASAQVLVGWAGLNDWLGSRHLRVGPGPDGRVRVRAAADVAGHRVAASAVGRLTVTTDSVRISAGSGLDVEIPLPGLPFRIRFISARSTRDGIVVDASAEGLVLRTGAS